MRISDWSSDVCSSDLAILHIIFQDAVLDQDILLRRGAFVVDGKRSASVHDAAIVDDRHAGRCHALADPAGEGRRALAVEVALQSVANRFVAQDAGPARARSEENPAELQSLMRLSYAVF